MARKYHRVLVSLLVQGNMPEETAYRALTHADDMGDVIAYNVFRVEPAAEDDADLPPDHNQD